MRSIVALLLGIGLGVTLWAATSNTVVSVGAAVSIACVVTIGSVAVECLLVSRRPTRFRESHGRGIAIKPPGCIRVVASAVPDDLDGFRLLRR
jgi:hypothetical protein